jgi:hypothetical protein
MKIVGKLPFFRAQADVRMALARSRPVRRSAARPRPLAADGCRRPGSQRATVGAPGAGSSRTPQMRRACRGSIFPPRCSGRSAARSPPRKRRGLRLGHHVGRDVKRDAVSERIAEVHEAVEPVLSCGEVGLKFLGQLVMHLRFAQAHMLALKLGAVAVLDVFLMDPNPRDVVDATERIHREGLNGNRRVHHDIALGDRFLIGRQ